MAILFCAITMSQYTHFNVSPITQITMQQTFRTISFVAGKFVYFSYILYFRNMHFCLFGNGLIYN